jgi:uncharacterized protein
MRFEWDETKNRSNVVKHGIDFEYAKRIWDDINLVTILDINSVEEERWLAIGMIGISSLLVAVHTDRNRDGDDIIRIISARKATKHERSLYEKAVG